MLIGVRKGKWPLAVTIMVTAAILIFGGISFADDAAAVQWDGRTADWDSDGYAFPLEGTGEPGSETDPFLISSGGQLKLLAELINDGNSDYNNDAVYYKLSKDVSLNDTSMLNVWSKGLIPKNIWTPIGSHDTPFKANFDGNGRTIRGVYIDNDSPDEGQGLFGYLAGSVKDLGVEESLIRSARCVGGIAGFVDGGSVTGCYNAGTVSGMSDIGGIAGYADGGSVTGCYNAGTVSGISHIGGIIGMICSGPSNDGIIDLCRNSGMISGSNHTGGIAGHVTGSELAECHNDGQISSYYYAGGIIGYMEGGSATDCQNDGQISGADRVGGITGGITSSGTVADCRNNGSIIALESGRIGGIAGIVQITSTVAGCSNTGAVSGKVFVGGIAGVLSTGSSIEDCCNTGSVSGDEDLGGIAGTVQNPNVGTDRNTVINCHNAGEIIVSVYPGTGKNFGG
ncbi:MAG: hypothetical protein FWG58_02985, partial [Methanomassiliicoccaceae archaeon]|nr:hypothetical protein [Methanomassiliicoccaceae archaeon]